MPTGDTIPALVRLRASQISVEVTLPGPGEQGAYQYGPAGTAYGEGLYGAGLYGGPGFDAFQPDAYQIGGLSEARILALVRLRGA